MSVPTPTKSLSEITAQLENDPNWLLNLLCVFQGFIDAAYDEESTLLGGLEHWWDFDEASGNAIAQAGETDLVLSGTNATTTGPNGETARSFDGSTTKFDATLDVFENSAISVSFWVKLKDKTSGIHALVSSQASPTTFICGVLSHDSEIAVFRGGNSQSGVTDSSGIDLTDGNWHAITYTYDGSVYLDGALHDTIAPFSPEPGAHPFSVGNAYGSLYGFMDIATVAIHNRSLTPAEVTEFYNAGTNLRYSEL